MILETDNCQNGSDSTHKKFRRDNKIIAVWLSLTMRFWRCDLRLQGTMRLENSCKLEVKRTLRQCRVEGQKMPNLKSEWLWRRTFSYRNSNTVAIRDVCQPKHEGGYKRMLHRISLLAGYHMTRKYFQALSRTNATTCTESKSKIYAKFEIAMAGDKGIHGNALARRELEPFAG